MDKCPNKTYARQARQLADQVKSPILRQAALVVSLAYGMTRTSRYARSVIENHQPLDDDVRRAALNLMDELTQ